MSVKNPDGKEPYTLEWLELIGFQFDDDYTFEGEEYYWINCGNKAVFDLKHYPYKEQGFQWYLANSNGMILIDDPCTRDGVRELCEVLNIPLKEPALTKVAV